MFKNSQAYSGFAVPDLQKAKQFYSEKLGLDVREGEMSTLSLHFDSGNVVFIYQKKDHQPAVFTILNFPVDDIDTAVTFLKEKGVSLERYENMNQDEEGISRGLASGQGPDIAWFTDPAGNILSVLQEK